MRLVNLKGFDNPDELIRDIQIGALSRYQANPDDILYKQQSYGWEYTEIIWSIVGGSGGRAVKRHGILKGEFEETDRIRTGDQRPVWGSLDFDYEVISPEKVVALGQGVSGKISQTLTRVLRDELAKFRLENVVSAELQLRDLLNKSLQRMHNHEGFRLEIGNLILSNAGQSMLELNT